MGQWLANSPHHLAYQRTVSKFIKIYSNYAWTWLKTYVNIIFVVDKGQVVEKGAHDDLIQNEDGPYFNLISRQMKAHEKLDRTPSTASLGGLVTKRTEDV